MSQLEISKRVPNSELGQVMNSAIQYAQRLREPVIDDVHVFRSLIATPSVRGTQPSTSSLITKNSIDLAYRTIFGKGNVTSEEEPHLSTGLAKKFEATLDQAGKAGRLADPIDLLGQIVRDPSLALQMVVEKALEGAELAPDGKNTDQIGPTLNEIKAYTLKATRKGGFEVAGVFDMKYLHGLMPYFIPAGLMQVIKS